MGLILNIILAYFLDLIFLSFVFIYCQDMKNFEISLLQEDELPAAEKLLRLSFGKFLGLTEPMNFGNGATYTNRWYRDPLAVFAAKVDSKLVGFSMVAN